MTPLLPVKRYFFGDFSPLSWFFKQSQFASSVLTPRIMEAYRTSGVLGLALPRGRSLRDHVEWDGRERRLKSALWAKAVFFLGRPSGRMLRHYIAN